MAKWNFTAKDNSGKFQNFKISANSKTEAIKKYDEKAKLKAKGEIIKWGCYLASF